MFNPTSSITPASNSEAARLHFRTHLVKHARASRVELRKIIEAAIAAGELVRTTDSRQLARTVEAVVGGSMMAWAYYEEGKAAHWMRHDLDAVLKPYLKKRAQR